ncbi:MAG: ADP-ribosylglycohydrolase family protein, partial [Planctomycetes bacterium]|nr:ADP-ribosylglycohydrolase family protein [Planctomycetota bacterium]
MEYAFSTLANLVNSEIGQALSVGHKVGGYRRRLARLADPKAKQNPRALARLYEDVKALGRPKNFPYQEPSELGAIRRLRPRARRTYEVRLSRRRLQDRILGAWLGRCAGCMVGKPVEGRRREQIQRLLESAGAYPLDGYFPAPKGKFDFFRAPKSLLRGGIKLAARDDDTDYTVLGLHILETYGTRFTTHNVAREWLLHFPYHMVYTAERVAYRNLINDIQPPDSATYDNPYREWIGAQIRADAWGYVCPGRPAKAAELAFRDAALSHVANGIYGEMFVAAMLAGAFVAEDLEQVVDIGLAEVPRTSRLYEAVSQTVEWCRENDDWEVTCDRILAAYGHYHGVHTINNACLVVMGLLHSEGDFGRAVGIAVMGGLDTDCNGATAGSVMGAWLGAAALPARWTH